MADINDIMDDLAKELADPNSALNAEMQGRTPGSFNLQEELDNIGRGLDAIRNAPQAPNPNAPARNENVPVAQAPYSLNVGRMSLGGPPISGQQGSKQQAYAAVEKAGLNPNTYAGVVAQAAYTQVAQETLDPEAAAAAAEAVAAQIAQGQSPSSASAAGVNAGRAAAAANYSNTYAADMEALGAPKGYAADMTALQGVMAQNALGPAPATIAAQSLAEEALGLTQQAQPTPSELSAMSMVANQAAANAYSNAIAAGATVAEATIAAEAAAQTAAQQAAAQIGIEPNSPTVTEAAMNAVNTQAVEVGRLSGMTAEEVAAAAQQAVAAAQEGKIGRNTLSQVGFLGPLGLAITAPEVEARREREAQAIMEQAMLAPVSPPTPEQNPRGSGRGVSLPAQNPARELQSQHELNAQPAAPPVEPTMLNPAFNIEGFTVNQATPGYFEDENPPTIPVSFNFTGMPATLPGTTFGASSPGLGPKTGLTAPQAFGVTGYNPGSNNLDDIGFGNPNAQPFDYTKPEMSAAHSFFNNPAPVTSFESYPGTLTSNTMVPGFTNPSSPVTSMPSALTGFTSSGVAYNAPQISAATQVSPAQSFFSAPEPVDPAAFSGPTRGGPGTTVSGVESSVPGISTSPIEMPGVSGLSPGQAAQVERGNVLGSLSLTPDPPSPNPSRGKSAITEMMDLEEAIGQQQARQERAETLGAVHAAAVQQQNQINAMIDLENNLASAYGLPAAEPLSAPTSSRSSSGRSGGRSSRGRSGGRSSRGSAKSTGTRSGVTWGDDGPTFSDSSNSGSTGASGCYIATDAVSAGAFSKMDKAKAELWCKRALHNHWAGETVRLGYQALSKRAVANGTASKHYDEFQRFVRYGRGLDKTFKGAVTFYARMAQFFAVGVINRLKAR